jgi:transposase
MLEARGCKGHLVNARHLKQVPGRNSEVQDCQWRQSLYPRGLLRGSCRPEAARCAVRASLRHRAPWLEDRAAPLQHLQKALHQRHVPWTHVRTDSTGATGLAMIRAMVAGERAPVRLARFRARRGARSTEDSTTALTGHDQPEQVFALQQALALYDASTAQVRRCDAAIDRRVQAITPVWPAELPPLDRADKPTPHPKNAPTSDARSLLSQRVGVDLSAIPGLHASTVHTLLSAIGLDLRKWPPAQAFCSWLG